MYFVDRQKLENTLTFMESQITLVKSEDFSSTLGHLALERLTQTIIECVLDVGNALIDGFVMRDPGSYEDIVDILLDEKVITASMEQDFKQILPIRKNIVQDYIALNHQEILMNVTKHIDSFAAFPQCVRTYLENEISPISTFGKKQP